MMSIPGPEGSLDAVIDPPAGTTAAWSRGPRAVVIFAHPHPQFGGTLHTKAVFGGAKALARIGCEAVRFNFRGTGGSAGTFDGGPGEQADFRAVIDFVAGRHPGLPIWAAGMSFGAWVALETGATDGRVSLLLALAPPAGLYEFPAARRSAKPKFLIHGQADTVVPLQSVRRLFGELAEPKELAVIDAADHLFAGRMPEVARAIERLLGDDAEPHTERTQK